MARYGFIGQQYFDSNGEPLSAGMLYFYSPGTVTLASTYTDEAETVANTNPVVLDAAGRQPNVFFTGQLKAVLTDSAGVQIAVADPIGKGAQDSALDVYSAATTYSVGNFVTASDGFYYKSLINGNVGNEPSISAAEWMQVYYLNKWNSAYSYQADDIALHSGRFWVSQTGSNLNSEPSPSSTTWRPANSELWLDSVVKVTADSPVTLVAGRHYLFDTSGGAISAALPAGVVGEAIAFTDATGNFGTTPLTLVADGAEEIMDSSVDHLVDIDYFSGVLRYNTDRGWIYS